MEAEDDAGRESNLIRNSEFAKPVTRFPVTIGVPLLKLLRRREALTMSIVTFFSTTSIARAPRKSAIRCRFHASRSMNAITHWYGAVLWY